MITSTKAINHANYWHTGQRSALYQFALTGTFEPANVLDCLNELQDHLAGTKDLKQIRALNELGRYLIKLAEKNKLVIEYNAGEGYSISVKPGYRKMKQVA